MAILVARGHWIKEDMLTSTELSDAFSQPGGMTYAYARSQRASERPEWYLHYRAQTMFPTKLFTVAQLKRTPLVDPDQRPRAPAPSSYA